MSSCPPSPPIKNTIFDTLFSINNEISILEPLGDIVIKYEKLKWQNDESEKCSEFKTNYPPPHVPPTTLLDLAPPLLLRQIATENSYNVHDIIKRIEKNHNNFREKFLMELARNKYLKQQLNTNKWFTEWITQSENYVLTTNYTAKY